jgi:alcohol dehydrogenase (cytochrome c)
MLTVAGLALAGGVASGCGGGGSETSTEEATTTATTATQATTGQAASGAAIFSDNCESCHGHEGAGGHIGPNLQKSSVAEHLDEVEHQVRNGGGAMPPFGDVLSDQQIQAVAHYVVEQLAPKQ